MSFKDRIQGERVTGPNREDVALVPRENFEQFKIMEQCFRDMFDVPEGFEIRLKSTIVPDDIDVDNYQFVHVCGRSIGLGFFQDILYSGVLQTAAKITLAKTVSRSSRSFFVSTCLVCRTFFLFRRENNDDR